MAEKRGDSRSTSKEDYFFDEEFDLMLQLLEEDEDINRSTNDIADDVSIDHNFS